MDKNKKTLKKIINVFCAIAVLVLFISFTCFSVNRRIISKSQYIMASPLKGTCLYKCPNAQAWKKFADKPIALPINSFILTKDNSALGLVFSESVKVYVSENTQMKIRPRHSRTTNPVVNIYLLTRKSLKGIFGKEEFRLTKPTVLSTI